MAAMNWEASAARRGSFCVEDWMNCSIVLVSSPGFSPRKIFWWYWSRWVMCVYFSSPTGLSKTIVSPSVNSPALPHRPAIFLNKSDDIGFGSEPCHSSSQSTRTVKRNGKSTPSASVVVDTTTLRSLALAASSISCRISWGTVELWKATPRRRSSLRDLR